LAQPALVQKSNITTYLCGPIAGRSDQDCHNWRTEAKQHLYGQVLDPMSRDYRQDFVGKECEIVELDKQDIRNADALLVHYDKPSVGTSMEVLYAWERGKYIVIVNASGQEHISPWLVYHSMIVVQSITYGCSLINLWGIERCGVL
jgi:nucleoside 2-deoxyribosyltransferase